MQNRWYMNAKSEIFWLFTVKDLTPVPEHVFSSVVSGLPA